MKPGRGHAKGASFERLVCKHLSLWATKGKKEDVFWRSAMSGGRATLLNRKGKSAQNSAGDITATGEEGHLLTDHFYVECKAYRDLNILSFVFQKETGALWKFWKETQVQAGKHRKTPLLIVKQNNLPPFAVIDLVGLTPLGEKIIWPDGPSDYSFLDCYKAPHRAIHFFPLQALFPIPVIKPKIMRKETK
jgi:hypothetical protein